MTPLPHGLGGAGEPLRVWTLVQTKHASTWSSGEGAFLVGGRWNKKGTRMLYTAVDPATCILEVAVHKTFAALDTVPHTLVSFEVTDPSKIYVINPADVPNPNWLMPGTPGAGQQGFGDVLIAAKPFVLIPSAVSRHSWNLLVNPITAAPFMGNITLEPFALDTRLNPVP